MQLLRIFFLSPDSKMEPGICLNTLNEHIVCHLCAGYMINATVIPECLHTFCKSCLVRFLKYRKTCPVCHIVIHPTNPLGCIRTDYIMNDIISKLVPNLEENERQRERAFYQSHTSKMETAKPSCTTTTLSSQPAARMSLPSIPEEKEMDFHNTSETCNGNIPQQMTTSQNSPHMLVCENAIASTSGIGEIHMSNMSPTLHCSAGQHVVVKSKKICNQPCQCQSCWKENVIKNTSPNLENARRKPVSAFVRVSPRRAMKRSLIPPQGNTDETQKQGKKNKM